MEMGRHDHISDEFKIEFFAVKIDVFYQYLTVFFI